MARMIAEVHDALRSAGADEDKARAAATAVAGPSDIDHRVTDLGTRMDRLEGRMDRLEGRMDGLEVRMDRLEGRMDRLEGRFERLEQRVAKIESDLAVLKWMVGFAVALAVANLFFTWQVILRLPAG
jgi:chaperonin cofactor prefoldin